MATAKDIGPELGVQSGPRSILAVLIVSAFRRLSRNVYLHIYLTSVSDDSGVLAL